jgi:competence protein ComFC
LGYNKKNKSEGPAMTIRWLGNIIPAYGMYRAFWTGIDWIYPPHCGGCQKFGERWCTDCQSKVVKFTKSVCPKCGSNEPHAHLCAHCKSSPPEITGMRSWGKYAGPLREAIHQLKYKHDLGLGEALSVHLIDTLKQASWIVDLITAVPLSVNRLAERGYNQSNLLARPVALAVNVPFQPNAISRARETISQVGLSARERKANVQDAFAANPSLVKGKAVLILDDVMTTGATLLNCSSALLKAGAKEVYGLTLAKAVLEDDALYLSEAAVSTVKA